MDGSKKSYEQLRVELSNAADQVTVGALYAHYKHTDKPYRIAGFVIWEENDSIAVLYQPVHEPGITFCRPLSVWLETVEWEGKRVPRFLRVD